VEGEEVEMPRKGEYQRLVKKYMPLLTKRGLDSKKAMREIATFYKFGSSNWINPRGKIRAGW